MSEESFYVTLPSNVKTENNSVSSDDAVENSMTSWLTQLHHWIHLEGSYEVGLAEFSYTYSWFNINKKQPIMLCQIDGTCLKVDNQYVEPGIYNDIHKLLDIIKKKMASFKVTWWRKPVIKMGESGTSIQVLPGEVRASGALEGGTLLYPKFGDELSGLLGLPSFKPRGEFSTDEAKKTYYDNWIVPHYFNYDGKFHPFDLRAGVHSLFVYSDIIKHRFVGNAMAQLLRKVEIPNSVNFGDQINITFERPHYHPITSSSLCSIQITIRDDTDSPISFKFGRCFAVLHFRRIKDNYE